LDAANAEKRPATSIEPKNASTNAADPRAARKKPENLV